MFFLEYIILSYIVMYYIVSSYLILYIDISSYIDLNCIIVQYIVSGIYRDYLPFFSYYEPVNFEEQPN